MPCVPAATFTTCRGESAEPTATTFERPPSLLPAPIAVELLPDAVEPTPIAVEPLPDAVELLPTAVLFDPDATAPEPPADEFEPLAPGGTLPPGGFVVYCPPRLVVRWSISVVSWLAIESSCDTFTASVPFLPAARPVICRLPTFTSPADDCGLLSPYAT
ncbi:hypothetical protein BLA24064_06317 [Burkholderia latens]|uniref:DNA-directed RNA polymerase II n=1 Tax=Burkholderia latens TaxID=488446 RepID=A0A6P2R6A1_9BURK|nr:hypothetical protein BLA24064_06317 [Burkholderia latens]